MNISASPLQKAKNKLSEARAENRPDPGCNVADANDLFTESGTLCAETFVIHIRKMSTYLVRAIMPNFTSEVEDVRIRRLTFGRFKHLCHDC